MTNKYKGVKAVSGSTKNLPNNCYIQISYDTSDNSVVGDFHCSIGQNCWSQYHDPNIISIGNFGKPTTMAEIKSAIEYKLAHSASLLNS